MADENQDHDLMRRYLLGQLAEDERQHFEETLMADNDLYNRVLLAEDEMVEEYLQGELSESERAGFEASFLSTSEGRKQVSFAKALSEYVSRVPATKERAAVSAREEPARVEPARVTDQAARVTERPARGTDEPARPSKVSRPAWWSRPALVPYFRLAAAAVIVVGLGLGIWRVFFFQSDVNKGLAALAQAYREQRPVEARISGLKYAPLANTRGEEPKANQVVLDRAERILLDAVFDYADPASHHALGQLYLAKRQFDKAIDEFGGAIRGNANNAEFHSDLGAAYLERASANSRESDKPNTNDFAKSLEHLNRAIEIDPSLLAAYFNKAICLQRMKALTLAKEAWEAYLKRDAGSEWSKEAERNLDLLRSQGIDTKTSENVLGDFLASYRQRDEARAWMIQSQTKEMITGIMIPFQLARRYIAANHDDYHEAHAETLGAFSFLGELEKKRSGDLFFAELAGFYAAAGEKNSATLRQAQDAIKLGYQLCLEGRYGAARPHFEDARSSFLRAGDTWESKVVDYWFAYCLSQQGDVKSSYRLLLTLAGDCRKGNYHWLEGQSYYWLAANSVLLGEYSQEIEQLNKALSIALSIGDSYNAQKTTAQLAKSYKRLGRFEEALEHNRLSLPSSDSYYVSFRQYWRSLNSLTDTLFGLRLYEAAEAYERETLHIAVNQFNDPVLIHNTYLRLGQIYSGQQNYHAAEDSLKLSLDAIQTIDQDASSRRLFGQTALQIGNVRRLTGDYASALHYYSEALRAFDSTDVAVFNYVTRKGMLLCHLLNNDDASVKQELPAVLALFEGNRQRIREEQNRNQFFDAEQDIYDLAIDYEYGRENKEGSFNYSESSRARSLLSGMIGRDEIIGDSASAKVINSAASLPLTLSRLQLRLPENVQLVEYAVLQNRLLIWIVSRTRFEAIQQPIPATAVETATNEYMHALVGSDVESVQQEQLLATKLHDWLIAPIEDYLSTAKEIVLVPDKSIFRLPFAALLSRQNGRRVVSDYTLLYAPSATVFALCSDMARSRAKPKEEERLLSVGDPKFSRERYPELRYLPMAATEARRIAAYYLASALLVHDEAAKKRIELKLEWADVIHFAAHYVTEDSSPARSKLVLSAMPGSGLSEGSDDLYLEEIQARRLPRARLVVLAACKTGIERYYAGEGLIGLSRAFLGAGVPLVIASQWSIESGSTSQLMIEFHRLRKEEGLPTTLALRHAQLGMATSDDESYRRPYYWAGFFPIGGYASF